MSTKIYSYNVGSASARSIAEGLGIKRLRENTAWRPRRSSDLVINWGCSETPSWHENCRWLNHPSHVAVAVNKLTAFQKLKEANVAIPEFTDQFSVAEEWKEDETIIVARSKLRGHSGDGTTIVELEDDLPDPSVNRDKLWVKYIKKTSEWRVHVIAGQVVDVQEKRKRNGEPGNSRIRNLANGYVFCREGIIPNESRDAAAIGATSALSLTFGAVDLIYNAKRDCFYVLEVNTAPGLEGSSVSNYVNAFRSLV